VLGCAYGFSFALVAMALWISPAALGGAYRWKDPVAAIETWVDRPGYLWISLAALLTVGILAKSYVRSASVMHRSQMRFMLWGLAVGLGPFVTLYAVPWAVGAPELPEWARFLAVVPLLIVPAGFTAALARYRLYDFDILLLRVVTEVTAVFFTAAVLAATVFLLRKGIVEFVPLTRGGTRYVGLLAAAIAYPKLRQWAKAAAERAFYRQRYSYRATLLDWARELNAETDLASLLSLLRTRIRDTLGVPEAEVLIRANGERFEAFGDGALAAHVDLAPDLVERLEHLESVALDDADSIPGIDWARHLFSMKVKGRLRAVLAIAERRGADERLTTEDRALVGTLAAHASTAIEAARLVREVRQRADEVGRLHALQAKILESSAVGLLLLDPAGVILAWNRALEEMYGLPRAEGMGRSLADVFPLHVARRIEREGRAGESRIFRLTLADRAGRRLIVNIAISRVEGKEGDGGLVVTFDDVTQSVEMEEQMLQQERLASLGLLAAGVAHEINTPLTGISSYTQLLLDDDAGGAGREMLEKIEAQSRRASGITRSLLSLARPGEAEFQPLDLNDAVRDVLQLFEPQVRRSAVRLRSELAETLPAVRGDKGKLQQVLLNLLLNARDAVSHEGEIAVSTSVESGSVVLEVADDGSGIPEEDLPRIFDPFFTTKGRGKGTGLGLSITFGIVREHGGRIRADSPPGEGACFRVELPTVDRAEALG
jgi:PAS domain S-box-containing protein